MRPSKELKLPSIISLLSPSIADDDYELERLEHARLPIIADRREAVHHDTHKVDTFHRGACGDPVDILKPVQPPQLAPPRKPKAKAKAKARAKAVNKASSVKIVPPFGRSLPIALFITFDRVF